MINEANEDKEKHMRDGKKPDSLPRREFLKGLTVGTAGVAAVALTTSPTTALAAEDKVSGYRETDHVRKYYELARLY